MKPADCVSVLPVANTPVMVAFIIILCARWYVTWQSNVGYLNTIGPVVAGEFRREHEVTVSINTFYFVGLVIGRKKNGIVLRQCWRAHHVLLLQCYCLIGPGKARMDSLSYCCRDICLYFFNFDLEMFAVLRRFPFRRNNRLSALASRARVAGGEDQN